MNNIVSLNARAPSNAVGNWTLVDALAEVDNLWRSTGSAVLSARESLYDFLGATYEHAQLIAGKPATLLELRATVRHLYDSDKQKKVVESAPAAQLLLTMALGVAQGSLRSKYKALLARAAGEGVPSDRESFKGWLRHNGGVVLALKDGVDSGVRKPRTPTPQRSFESCAGDLICDFGLRPSEERAFTAEPYKGFVIALFYVDPATKRVYPIADLVDTKLVDDAVRLASDSRPSVTLKEAA
jgi:hypothetical protein